jgi:hypothetical protein
MILFSISHYANNMPTRWVGKLLTLGGPNGLLRGSAALMRALPLPGAASREDRSIRVSIHFGRPIRQGRKASLSRKKKDDRTYGV